MKSKSKNARGQAGAKHDIKTSSRRTEKRRVDSLRPHPRQAELFADLPENEFLALVEDIRQNGIRIPPEVLPDGTILAGHQRVRAARELGREEIHVVIRWDLEDADENAILEAFLEDNFHRRQLSKLQQARCAIKLAEIECDRETIFSVWRRDPKIIKSVSSRLECSPKNASRYIAVSKTPGPVQEALDGKLVTLVEAAAIAHLRQEVQEKLAASIARLLKQTEVQGVKTIKKKTRAIVETAFNKTRRPQPIPAPSPVRPLRNIKESLAANLKAAEENYAAIISELRGDNIDAVLGPDYVSLLKSWGAQIVPELRDGSKTLAELLDRIEQSLGSPPDGPQAQSA